MLCKIKEGRDDRGEAVAQTVLAVPVVLGILWIAIQITVLLHGANVATSVAGEAASAASRYGASVGVGERAAARALTDFGATAASPPRVSFSGRDVVATISIRLPRVAPFFPSVISRSVRESREDFISEVERQR